MKKILLLTLYTGLGISILGVRLAMDYLSATELSLFISSAIVIGLAGTLLHLGFSKYSERSGLNGVNSNKFKYTMIAITYLASFVVYTVVLTISKAPLELNFDLIVYTVILPSIVLAFIASYYIGLEKNYNQRLAQIKN